MSEFVIKFIAIIAMVIDHIGYIFFPQTPILRVIGRLTMPIMAFFAAEGFLKTRNRFKYLTRLLVFAIISELPYRLAFNIIPDKPFYPSNVIFTIFLGVLALTIGEFLENKTKIPTATLWAYLPCMYLAEYFHIDWSWLGVLMIIALYHAGKSKTKQALFLAGAYLSYIAVEWCTSFIKGTLVYGLSSPIHLFGLLSLLLIFIYNGKRGCPRPLRYLFYIFYPLHLIVLYIFKVI
jgi:hypothetical protein